MILGLLFPIMVVVLIVIAIRRGSQSGSKGAITGGEIRRFFQFAILFALVMITATGLAGLLGQILSRESELVVGSSLLARNLSFIVVGLPLTLLLAYWLRRSFDEDRETSVWSLYVAATSLTSLIVLVTSLNSIASSLLRGAGFDERTFAQIIVWAGVWAIHWRLDQETPARSRRLHLILGSLVGLLVSVIGLATLLSGLLGSLINANATLLVNGYTPLKSGLALLIAGVPTWWWYWIRSTHNSERDEVWNAYVLLAGVAGGLIMSVVAASTVLYRLFVWVIGDPATSDAQRFFAGTPTAAGIALTGLLVWWYHQAVLAEGPKSRTEIRRVYEYLIAGIAAISAGVGISILVVSALESLTRSNEVMGQSPVNTLLSALTLLVVALPIWYLFWGRIASAVKANPDIEHASPTRRAYLFMLFGIGGVVAVISLILGVYFLFQGIFESRFGVATLRRMRTPIGILISTATISGYHWTIYRKDKAVSAVAIRIRPRRVVLVGPRDLELARRINQELGARVEWHETANPALSWSTDLVISRLSSTQARSVLITADREEVVELLS